MAIPAAISTAPLDIGAMAGGGVARAGQSRVAMDASNRTTWREPHVARRDGKRTETAWDERCRMACWPKTIMPGGSCCFVGALSACYWLVQDVILPSALSHASTPDIGPTAPPHTSAASMSQYFSFFICCPLPVLSVL